MLICADPWWLSLEKPSKKLFQQRDWSCWWLPCHFASAILGSLWVLPKLQQFPMPGIETDLLKNKDADDDRNGVYDDGKKNMMIRIITPIIGMKARIVILVQWWKDLLFQKRFQRVSKYLGKWCKMQICNLLLHVPRENQGHAPIQ